MRRIVCAVAISLILTLISVGLQLAGCLTSGWKIIEAEGPHNYPWTPYSMQNDGRRSNKASISCSLWVMEFCIRGRCFENEEFGKKYPKFFEETPSELQALSVASIIFSFFAFLSYSPLFKSLKEPINCNGINIAALMFMSGSSSLALIFLAINVFQGIEDKLREDKTTVVTVQLPYSMLLVAISVATSFLASVIVAVLVCKLNQRNQVPARREMEDDEVLVKPSIASKTRNMPPSLNEKENPVDQSNDQKQVVYSIHL